MEKRYRLRKSDEFKQVRDAGRSRAHPLLVLYVRPNELAHTRVGISVSRRIGNAVIRNRVKRLVREAVRLRLGTIAPGWDLLFIARGPIAAADFVMACSAVEQLLQRFGLLTSPPAHDWGSRRAASVVASEASHRLQDKEEDAT